MKTGKTFLTGAAILLLSTATSVISINASYDYEQPDNNPSIYKFFPSLIKIKSEGDLNAGNFTDPDTCGGCHSEKIDLWEGSMHSNAFKDPVWQALWRQAFKDTDGKIGTECVSCHSPIGMVTKSLVTPDDIEKLDSLSARGVQCDYCHSVDSTHYLETKSHEPHNMAITLDPGDIKRGPWNDSDSSFHKTTYSALHESAEFCGNCHNVLGARTGFPLAHTYDEWKQSVYARAGIVCQNCHMASAEDAATVARTLKPVLNPGQSSDIGPDRPDVHDHWFVGGNAVVTGLLGSKKHAASAEQRLKSAAIVTASAPPEIPADGLVVLRVKVENTGTGHNLPTSLTELRQMWLDVSTTDASGNIIFHSGYLDKNGDLDSDAAIFNSYPVDENGNYAFKPWKISHFAYNRTIPPKGFHIETYKFIVPSDTAGQLKIKAVLRYRSFPQSVANELLGDKAPVVPVIDMASTEIYISR
jgi:hypothetical protein